MTLEQLEAEFAAIKERTAGHTPGPWWWSQNDHGKSVALYSKGLNTVMDFVRYGAQGAAPRFQIGGIMKRSDALGVPRVGDEHNASWRKDIDHPDARLQRYAPDLLTLAESAIAEARKYRWAIKDALTHAAGRWPEWGDRAAEVERILDAALTTDAPTEEPTHE